MESNFNFYSEAVSQNSIQTPRSEAVTALFNAKSFTQLAIKSGALDDNSIELLDQAEAIMQMVRDNLYKQKLPAEFGYHMANAVNELQACTKLCTGTLQTAVFDLSAAVEKLRGDHES